MLLAGRTSRGHLVAWTTRYGATRYPSAYPPDTSIRDRLRLRACERCPVAGFARAIAVWCASAPLLGAQRGLLAASLIYCGGFAVLGWITRQGRPGTCHRPGIRYMRHLPIRTYDDYEFIELWSEALTKADEDLATGHVSAAEHQRIWRRAWEALDEHSSVNRTTP